MISYDQLFGEMSRQLNAAKESADPQKRREALAAIRSLCEVGLGHVGEVPVRRVPTAIVPASPEVKSLTSLDSRPLQEEGANGDSIFDF